MSPLLPSAVASILLEGIFSPEDVGDLVDEVMVEPDGYMSRISSGLANRNPYYSKRFLSPSGAGFEVQLRTQFSDIYVVNYGHDYDHAFQSSLFMDARAPYKRQKFLRGIKELITKTIPGWIETHKDSAASDEQLYWKLQHLVQHYLFDLHNELEALRESEIDDFVAHGLGATDPFTAVATKEPVIFPNGRRVTEHALVGEHWHGQVTIDYDASENWIRLQVDLNSNSWAAPKNFVSYWTMGKHELSLVNAAVIKLCRRFDDIVNIPPGRVHLDEPDRVQSEGFQAMLTFDNAF